MTDLAERLDAVVAGQARPNPETAALLASLTVLAPLRATPPRTPAAEQAGLRRLLADARGLPAVSAVPQPRLTGWWNRMRQGVLPMPKLIPLTVVLSLSVLFVGAGGAAYAAQDSLPTQPLYPIKLATEDLRLSLTPAAEDRLALLLSLIETRTQEMVQLTEQGELTPLRTADRLQTHLAECLRLAAAQGDAQMIGDLNRIRDRLSTQTRLMENAHALAPTDAALGEGLRAMQQTQAMVEFGLQEPQRFREQVGAGRNQDPAGPNVTPGTGPGPGAGPGPGPQNLAPAGPSVTPGTGPGPGPQYRPLVDPTLGAPGGPANGGGAPSNTQPPGPAGPPDDPPVGPLGPAATPDPAHNGGDSSDGRHQEQNQAEAGRNSR